MSDGDEGEPVGSLGEEAAKLLHALQGWAKDSGSDYADATAAAAQGAAGAFQDLNEHIATGGQDCKYCPLCQAISLVRQTSPEVKAHLTNAAASLMQAAAGVMAAHASDQAHTRRADASVEKIDLSDDGDWEDD